MINHATTELLGAESPMLQVGSTGPAYAHPRATLSTVPEEIIEQIADGLRSDVLDEGSESAEAYMADNCTDFAYSRFDLSSFSKVCASVRRPVERRMYRDIHIHFAGWNATHDCVSPNWRGASLRLLIRTLKGRIDLRGRVRSVHMDWYNDSMYSLDAKDFQPVAAALRQFFTYCKLVHRLLIMDFPSKIFSKIPALSHIATVATSSPGSTDVFPTIVKTFPALQNLYLANINTDIPRPTYALHDRLRKLHMEGSGNASPTTFVFWALEVCADIIEELHLNCSVYTAGHTVEDSFLPTRHTLSPLATNLRSLRLGDNHYNFLAYPNGNLAHVIRRLPSLQHLHMSSRVALHPNAFFALPPTLHSLYLSGYRTWGNNESLCHEFVVALGKCLAEAADMVVMVAILGATKEDLEGEILNDLSPLHRVCDDHNIPFHLDIHLDTYGPLGDIRILFA